MDWETTHNPKVETKYVTDIEDVMCCTAIENDECRPIVLYNVSTDTEPNRNVSFKTEPKESGTNICATHHICSLLNLFIDMKPAPKIIVTGVAGSLMASGIGNIEFVLTDDKGKKEKITLQNVIYLPESAKNLISTSLW